MPCTHLANIRLHLFSAVQLLTFQFLLRLPPELAYPQLWKSESELVLPLSLHSAVDNCLCWTWFCSQWYFLVCPLHVFLWPLFFIYLLLLSCVGTSDWWTRSGTWNSWKLSQQAWVVFSQISSLSWLATQLHSACAPPQYKDQRPLNLEMLVLLPLTSRDSSCLIHRGQHRHGGSRCETGFVQLQQDQGRLQRVAQEWSHLWKRISWVSLDAVRWHTDSQEIISRQKQGKR